MNPAMETEQPTPTTLRMLLRKYEPLSREWNKLRQIYDEYENRLYKTLHIKQAMKNGTRFPKNYWQIREKNELEIALLEVQIDEIDQKCNTLWRQMEGVFKFTHENTKYKPASSSAEKQKRAHEPCAICYDSSVDVGVGIGLKHRISTNCGHIFCKPCMTAFLQHNYDMGLEITCPCCRNDKLTFWRFTK
jgi:hypothetical protein